MFDWTSFFISFAVGFIVSTIIQLFFALVNREK